jgi:hypothetical protein
MTDAERGALALEALKDFYAIRDLGDFIYDVRESEGKGWHGPQVTKWSDADQKAKRALEMIK